ncbi:hypothetical protein B0T25DRAFT_366260 [Lasiosphaeria hispida]|uniref:Uncharacterized protein n=1 Tax=Lasiosphaeria hispida TaxID=260671 RepID=A0AAJ0H5L8_9PEZI|nr:hypothetical protein B0T25DRAFT_366260 [Lasiosphaeria hispida]
MHATTPGALAGTLYYTQRWNVRWLRTAAARVTRWKGEQGKRRASTSRCPGRPINAYTKQRLPTDTGSTCAGLYIRVLHHGQAAFESVMVWEPHANWAPWRGTEGRHGRQRLELEEPQVGRPYDVGCCVLRLRLGPEGKAEAACTVVDSASSSISIIRIFPAVLPRCCLFSHDAPWLSEVRPIRSYSWLQYSEARAETDMSGHQPRLTRGKSEKRAGGWANVGGRWVANGGTGAAGGRRQDTQLSGGMYEDLS